MTCPGSSAQTLRFTVRGDIVHFYCNTGTELCHASRSLLVPPVLQEGVQGRETWSADSCRLPRSKRVLCATSAEDNTIKIIENLSQLSNMMNQPRNRLKTLYRYPDPDGTLQNVCWSTTTSTGEDDTALLFATAAKERLYALRVVVPAGSQAVRITKAGEISGNTRETSDSRTMALAVLKTANALGHVILAGSSDGSLKVSLSAWQRGPRFADDIYQLWNYDDNDKKLTLRWACSWHDRCLLSLKLLSHRGEIWAVSGDTSGRLAVWLLDCQPARPTCILENVHQSGVNCLDARFQGKPNDGCMWSMPH